eukprot:CAMPEP_0173421672 /NCGR_PEP_ID=MMETSP1357-20121228/2699_1 /TAXON_ID=77926 /ORGANISM="Hemiselmis rufescens, Strain PCC563" /LENGTH=197 /DNA_ID=CAMNT_0014384613 /DNA_START=68 /DNA_END=661 /DNA_ORIENTATION=-
MSSEFEGGRKLFAMISGIIFGVGVLTFLDAIAYNNYCLGGIKIGEDPCHWGYAPNSTAPLPPNTTPPPMNQFHGWQVLDGRRGLVFVPFFLALISLFMVNAVDLNDLKIDPDWVVGGSPGMIRLWMFVGAASGFSGLSMSIWVHVTEFSQQPDTKDGPGIGNMLCVLMITISSLGMWLARSYGLSNGWGDQMMETML